MGTSLNDKQWKIIDELIEYLTQCVDPKWLKHVYPTWTRLYAEAGRQPPVDIPSVTISRPKGRHWDEYTLDEDIPWNKGYDNLLLNSEGERIDDLMRRYVSQVVPTAKDVIRLRSVLIYMYQEVYLIETWDHMGWAEETWVPPLEVRVAFDYYLTHYGLENDSLCTPTNLEPEDEARWWEGRGETYWGYNSEYQNPYA